MEREKIQKIFENFFEKYKKTEGDRTVWSAYWAETKTEGVLELNLTKCPRGTVFKFFVDNKKISEVIGWDDFFKELEKLKSDYPNLYDEDKIFSDMEFAS
jgi:hypothetical protein